MKPIHILSSATILLGSVLPMPAADPAWWLEGSPPVIDPAAQPENRAIASIGQAKWMAKNALESLRAILPDTADLIEADLVGLGKPLATWAAPIGAEEKQAQFSPLLIGQLKAISAPFYQHLHAAAPLWLASEMTAYQLPPGSVPWTATTVDDSNRAPAVIGQLKAVFSFDFAADRETGENTDGISDLWEYTTFNSLLTITPLNAGIVTFEDDPSDTGQEAIDPSTLDEDSFDPNLEDFDDEPATLASGTNGEAAPAPMGLEDLTPSQRKAKPDTIGISSSILNSTLGCWTFEGRMAGTSSYPTLYKDYSGRGNHATNWNPNAIQQLGMPSYATMCGVQRLSVPAKVLENQQSFSLSTWVKFPISLQNEAQDLPRVGDMKPLFSFYQSFPKPLPTSPPLGQGRIFALRKTTGAPNWFIGGYQQTTNVSNNPVTFFTGDSFIMPDIDDGRWHHLAVTYANSSNGQEVWLDGERILNIPLKNEHFVDFSHPDTQINFGSLPPGHNSYFFSQVHLDRLRLHSGKLSSDQIQSLHQQDIDGDGLWDITETATRYTYGNNLTAFLSSPYVTNAANSDTDDDGLKDLAEQNLGTRMDRPDTDGDGLQDGWEHKYSKLGLDPLKKNKVGADIDGDGLSWLQEYAQATNPGRKDTDGDGKNDKIDSTPTDPSNPPASERYSVLLGIGDKSGSLSENYDLNVYKRNSQTGAETRVYTLTSGGHGKYKEEPKDFFTKGHSYTFQIDWQSTNGKPQTNAAGTLIDGADFDYTFKVVPQGSHGAVLIDSFHPTDPGAQSIQLLSASANDVATSKSEFAQKYESRRVGLIPVEVKYVDRDVMTNQWAQKKPYNASQSAIYAGPHSGDMIEWRIAGDTFANQSFSWEAEHLDGGEIIPGPSGTGVNFWRIADEEGNDPTDDEWLKWKPGEYAIFCEIFGERMEVNRVRLGYRSDHVLVIGQIVPTFTHDPDKPAGAAATSWAEGVADDFVNTVLPAAAPASVYDFMADGLKTVFASQPERGAEAWTASWAGALGVPPGIVPSWFPSGWIPPPIAPISLPPASIGPAAASFGGIHGPVGTMTANHHYWATQHMLNTNPDTPKVPLAIYIKRSDAPSDDEAFAYIFTERQYRICHDFQAKFLLDDDGKIDQTTFEARHNRAANGPTKMKIGEIDAGTWGTVYTPPTTTLPSLPIPLPPCDIKAFPDEPSETNSHNGEISHDSAGKEVSSFATARIGQKGRQVSYRQFGKDAPWIFSEIIFEMDDDGKVNLLGRTSTTVQWNLVVDSDGAENVTVERSPNAPPSTPGISIFNNLNLYARSEIDRFVRLNGGLLEMEGHLQSFVESGSGAWPEPAIPPTVK